MFKLQYKSDWGDHAWRLYSSNETASDVMRDMSYVLREHTTVSFRVTDNGVPLFVLQVPE